MRVLAWPDGSLGDPDEPALLVDDLGALRGDGIFESILVVNGRAREVDAHLDRMARSAARLDLPAPDRTGWLRAIRTAIGGWRGGEEMVLRLILTRGPEHGGGPTSYALGCEVGPTSLRQRREGISVLTLDRGLPPDLMTRAPWLLLGAKSLSYAVNMAALRYAAAAGSDDVIFTATDGSVLEGPTATVVVADGRTLRTPPTSAGILAGTTQQALYRAAEDAGWATKVEPLVIDDLLAADAVVMASSVRLLARVHTVDGARQADESTAITVHQELVDLYEGLYRAGSSGG
jgi:4-amino-4-deoxychorismate lyase